MKAFSRRIFLIMFVLCCCTASAQTPDIFSFVNGEASWTNVSTNAYYTIEWNSPLTDIWYSSYTNLLDIQSSCAIVTTRIPLYYRVSMSDTKRHFISPVPATGQTNSQWIEEDGYYQIGVKAPIPRFVVGSGDAYNCVLDNLTGLMWIRNPDNVSRTWSNCITYCESLDGSNGRGRYTDWRMPNMKELLSLVDYGNIPFLPTNHPFSLPPILGFVSSTRYPGPGAPIAYRVNFNNGFDDSADILSHLSYVWPVRGGQ